MQVAINVKSWGLEYAETLAAWLNSRLPVRVTAVAEEVGTMAGSGCAVVNVLQHVDCLAQAAPFVAMLAAGEGSRLWGVSLSVGFVKGLLNVMGHSLIEQSFHQARSLLQQAPPGFCLVTGTDNLFEPQHATLRLCDAARTPFVQSPHRGIHTFSIPIRVRREGAFLRETFENVSQLGIMFADASGASVQFVEKPTYEQIEENVKRFDSDLVFCNAFVFAMSREFAAELRRVYSARLSTGLRLFESTEFDWSGHVLTPLSLVHAKERVAVWNSPSCRTASSRKYFPNDGDWEVIWKCAEELYRQFGPVRVLDAGETSLWYDCGLCSDLMALHMRALHDKQLSESIFSTERFGSNIFAGCEGARDMPGVSDCVFSSCHGLAGSVTGAKKCLFIESEVSKNCDLGGVESSLFYRVDVASIAHVRPHTVYFSFLDKKGARHTGEFELEANPKRGDLLGKPITGIGRSFREIQQARDIKLPV
jgi:hypothetical protein